VNTATDNYKYVTPFTMKNWTGGPTNAALLNGTNSFTGKTNYFAGDVTVKSNLYVNGSASYTDLTTTTFNITTNWNAALGTNYQSTNLVGLVPDANLASNVVRSNSPIIHSATLIDPTIQGTLSSTQANLGAITLTNVNGSFWTNLTGANVTGAVPSATGATYATNLTDGANILAGTVADARLSTNIPRKDGTNAMSGTNTFSKPVWISTVRLHDEDNAGELRVDGLLAGMRGTTLWGDANQTNKLTVGESGVQFTNTSAPNQGAVFGATSATLAYGGASTLVVTNGVVRNGSRISGSSDPAFSAVRTLGAGTENGHAFDDSSSFERTGYSYNSYNAAPIIQTWGTFGHYAGFQVNNDVQQGYLQDRYGFFDGGVIEGGFVTNDFCFFADDGTLSGGTNYFRYGFFSNTQTNAQTANYAFFSAGSTPSVLGALRIGSTNALGTEKLTVTGPAYFNCPGAAWRAMSTADTLDGTDLTCLKLSATTYGIGDWNTGLRGIQINTTSGNVGFGLIPTAANHTTNAGNQAVVFQVDTSAGANSVNVSSNGTLAMSSALAAMPQLTMTNTAGAGTNLVLSPTSIAQTNGSAWATVGNGAVKTSGNVFGTSVSGTIVYAGNNRLTGGTQGLLVLSDTSGVNFGRLIFGTNSVAYPGMNTTNNYPAFSFTNNYTSGTAYPVVAVTAQDGLGACDLWVKRNLTVETNVEVRGVLGIRTFGGAALSLTDTDGAATNILTVAGVAGRASFSGPIATYGPSNTTVAIIQTGEWATNLSSDDIFVDFQDAGGASVGSIAGVSDGLIAYGTFTGVHNTQVDDTNGLFLYSVLELDAGKPRWNDVLVTPAKVRTNTIANIVPVLVLATNAVATNWWVSDGQDQYEVWDTNYVQVEVPFVLYSTNTVYETNRVIRIRDIEVCVTNQVVTGTTNDTWETNAVVSCVTNSVPWTNAQGNIAYRRVISTNYVTVTTPVNTTNLVTTYTTNAAEYRKSAKQDQLFKSKLCDNRRSNRVIGVYAGRDAHGRDQVLGLGVGYVWVAKVNQSTNGVALGDLLISSGVPGHAEVGDDNIVKASTLGRATEAVNWSAPKYVGKTNALISCVLKAG
jgi:hypothetical protein